MKIKTRRLEAYLRHTQLTTADLARRMGVSVSEIERLLDGKAVGINTARKFIRYFSAEEAQHLIDWEAIGKENPLEADAAAEPDDDDECDDAFDEETIEDDLEEMLIEGECYDNEFSGGRDY